MSEPSTCEQQEQRPEVDWAALKIAVEEMAAALALVRDNPIMITCSLA